MDSMQDKPSSSDIPPGATEKNVADDIPIMASEGEYIIPANVVNYIGLEKIQGMVDKAKEALGDTSVQTPGGEMPDDDELPFDPSELMGMPHEMAAGGPVTNPVFEGTGVGIKPYKNADGQVIYIPTNNGQPAYAPPPGYTESEEQPGVVPQESMAPRIDPQRGGASMDNSATENRKFVDQNESPLAGSPKDWSIQDFINFGKQRDDVGTKLIKGMASMIPGGKLAMSARNKYLDRSTSKLLDQMLETGIDLQGQPIGDVEKTELLNLKTDLIKQMGDQSGLNLNPMDKLGDIFERFTNFTSTGRMDMAPKSSVSPEAERMMTIPSSTGGTNSSDNQYSGGGYGMGSDIGRDPDKGPSSGQMASGGLYNKGGLITRRSMKKC